MRKIYAYKILVMLTEEQEKKLSELTQLEKEFAGFSPDFPPFPIPPVLRDKENTLRENITAYCRAELKALIDDALRQGLAIAAQAREGKLK